MRNASETPGECQFAVRLHRGPSLCFGAGFYHSQGRERWQARLSQRSGAHPRTQDRSCLSPLCRSGVITFRFHTSCWIGPRPTIGLWATCTQDERLVLFQLAEDGWANLKNELAIQQLQRKRLVKCLPGLRIKNESFRRFIRESLYRSEEITTWEQEGEQSVWRSLKLSLAVAAAAVGVWLLYSQQAFFSTAVGYLSALGGAATVVIKLLSDLRGGKASQGSGGE